MSRKLILTSIISISVGGALHAGPSHVSDTFPNPNAVPPEYMLEDYTYTNAAVYNNIGAYSGNVVAIPVYAANKYDIAPGEYLARGTTTGTACPAGYFCAGLTNVEYSTTTDQGLDSCASVTDGAFPNSADGASSEYQCYRPCTTAHAGIAHATAVSGNDYYNNDGHNVVMDTCAATECEDGYSVKHPNGPDLTSLIGFAESVEMGYKTDSRNSGGAESRNAETYGITTDNTFVVDFGPKGKIHGHSRCSTHGQNPYIESYVNDEPMGYTYNTLNGMVYELADDAGKDGAEHCYCQLDGYTPDGGVMQSLSMPWAYVGNSDMCDFCAEQCAVSLGRGGEFAPAFRSAVFNTVSHATCEPNTISITWGGASQADIDANNAGQCTYGGNLRTPRAAEQVDGKTFLGWRIVPAGQH